MDLNLAECGMGDDGAATIAEALRSNTALTMLNLMSKDLCFWWACIEWCAHL